jgi:hypothetical protein
MVLAVAAHLKLMMPAGAGLAFHGGPPSSCKAGAELVKDCFGPNRRFARLRMSVSLYVRERSLPQ